jgi:ubiquinone/menaquinone biosynthesis C-methylase UbiE
MEQQGVHVVRHFTDVANRYDDLYCFTYDYLPEFAIKHLQLRPDDVLADIGAGTGAISSLIWKKAGIKNVILCTIPISQYILSPQIFQNI